MAILVDYSQVCISNLHKSLGKYTNAEINTDIIRHMILNSLRRYNVKFGKEYGELTICCDGGKSWRREIFPYYKAQRKISRDKSELDWNLIFDALAQIREEIREYMPYRVVYHDNAEADDVISTICQEYGTEMPIHNEEMILILSGDKDFIQLQKYQNVAQYDPIRDKWIKNDNPQKYLVQQILKGDSSDGVPNIMSKDSVFVDKIRQKPMTEKRLEEFTKMIPPELQDNYNRNKLMIDLMQVPSDIKKEVLHKYNEQAGKNRSRMLTYFIKFKLKHLTESLSEF